MEGEGYRTILYFDNIHIPIIMVKKEKNKSAMTAYQTGIDTIFTNHGCDEIVHCWIQTIHDHENA